MIRRLKIGDVLIGLALLALVVALVTPAVRAWGFRSLVDSAVTDVDALARAVQGFRTRTGAWPPRAAPGEVPSGLSSTGPTRLSMGTEEYELQWFVWEVVEEVEAPPSPAQANPDPPPDSVGPEMIPVVREVGALGLRSVNEDLLAELLLRYGGEVSFVRDSVWTLVLRRGATP